MNDDDELKAILEIANTKMEHVVKMKAIGRIANRIANRGMDEHEQFEAVKKIAKKYSRILFVDFLKIKKLGHYDFEELPKAIIDYYRLSLQKWYHKGFKTVVGYKIVKKDDKPDSLYLTEKDK